MIVLDPSSGSPPAATPSGTNHRPELVELAENRLRGNSYLSLKNISCEFHEGALILRGCVPSYYLKQVAQMAVTPMEGVSRIVNQIEVVAPRRAAY